MRSLRRAVVALVLAGIASAGIAVGAELTLGDPAALQPSDLPGLLGPITETGRTGWECRPERAARARDVAAGDLPAR